MERLMSGFDRHEDIKSFFRQFEKPTQCRVIYLKYLMIFKTLKLIRKQAKTLRDLRWIKITQLKDNGLLAEEASISVEART